MTGFVQGLFERAAICQRRAEGIVLSDEWRRRAEEWGDLARAVEGSGMQVAPLVPLPPRRWRL